MVPKKSHKPLFWKDKRYSAAEIAHQTTPINICPGDVVGNDDDELSRLASSAEKNKNISKRQSDN